MTVKFPNVTVDLTSMDGNAFALIGGTTRAMRRAGVSADDVDAFRDEALASESYDQVIQTIMRTVNVE